MTCWPYSVLLLLTAAAVAATPDGSSWEPSHGSFFSGRFRSEGYTSERHTAASDKTVLTVGYLTAIKGELKDKQGLAISGALTMALDEVSPEFIFTFFLF